MRFRDESGVQTSDSSSSNYWNLGVPDFVPVDRPLRAEYDVAVIGAGYSGLAVAWGLARHGLSVLVLEERSIGYGASSRNGGMVGPSFHELGMVGLTRKYGEEKTKSIMRTSVDALAYCRELFEKNQIDCDLQLTGRIRGARSTAHLDAIVAECARLKAAVGLAYEVVSPSELHLHTGSNAYVGGVLYPMDGGLHPKRLVNALATRAEAAGAQICQLTPACRIEKRGRGFQLSMPQAVVSAQQVVIATNGYSDSRVPAMNNRIVPIDVSVAATRPLGMDRVRAMSPRLHMHGESGRVFIWSRPSPDHTRFIFGGRLSRPNAPLHVQCEQIATAVQRIYPDVLPTDLEYVWNGKIAYTSDHAPHLNEVDGLWLIGGYCGSGVTRSLFFADKLVRKIARQPGGETPFDDIAFPVMPFRRLAPLGARIATSYYGWLDQRDSKASK
ncbi:MAG: FAD-dependent oxidoreductase [Thermomonas sp.]